MNLAENPISGTPFYARTLSETHFSSDFRTPSQRTFLADFLIALETDVPH